MNIDQRHTGLRQLGRTESWPEDERLLALQSLRILDTPPEPAFERLVALARRLFQVPMVAVSLIDRDRQWFKARCGLDVGETERSISFCTHAIAAASAVFCVPDATRDALFADNPLVTGPPGIRFYAGAVVRAPNGAPVGTVCIIDQKPRPALEGEERQALLDLAALAGDELQLRATAMKLERQVSQLERAQRQLEVANTALRRKNDAHRADLAAAAAVQRGNLPPSPVELPPLRVASLHIPSSQLSGDMYGYGRFDERSSFVWLGDVVGHGTEAALRAVTLSKIVNNNLKPGSGYVPPAAPAAFLGQVNSMMLWPDEAALSYFTLLYGRYVDGADSIALAFAGGPWPLLLPPDGPARYIEGSGLPLGLFAEVAHDEVTVPLLPGARLLLFSDGLQDSRDGDGRPFGEDRLLEWLERTRELRPAAALARLREHLEDWSGGRPPEDDIAVVLIERGQ
jgi:sigma-B regulation protein RsbU (phosphoserine phosphatase)